ncbi:MAG: membrane protein insertion efficiency factor YidD [Candidatus Margulisbacteria bacterium]|nr:membrane protein insertion efficiency factor YidD [Candidatus Margulisiibacteriota bacterium]
MKTIAHYFLLLYQKISPYPMRCRFYPSCSQYADEAILRYGCIKGGILALKRLIRCNQWFPGGYDPVS